MTEGTKTGLTGFQEHRKSFPQRFVDSVFSANQKESAGDIFAEAFSDNGYTANIIDAQHWATKILNDSDLEPMEPHAELDLIQEIFFQCFVPYDTGELSLEYAKAKGVDMATDFFRGTNQELMFDRAPENSIWFAAHIYHLCERAKKDIDECVSERADLDALAGNVDDFYACATEEERQRERRYPYNNLLDIGVRVGFLYRDAWWKENHETAAMNYYSQVEARKKGSPRGGASTSEKYVALKNDCLGYFAQAYKEKGVSFLGAPLAIVAQTIREIALRERPNDFLGPRGKPLSERWFYETLEDFQADGKFGAEIIKATEKA